MTTDSDPWDDPTPAHLPTIVKPTASPGSAVSSMGAFEEEEDDDGGGLWVDDEDDAGWTQVGSIVSEQDLLSRNVTAEVEFSQQNSEVDSLDADALFRQMVGGEQDVLPDAEALFRQMQGGTAEEELPDAAALFRQMQGGAIEEELPDAEALFRQMQGGAAEEELPDAEALFRQMQGGAAEAELPDAEALFRQMQGGAAEAELPDAGALFQQMQAASASQELPDAEALFRQMQAQSSPPASQSQQSATDEDELPDPNALFLAMQAERTAEEDDLPDPNALFLQMKAGEPEVAFRPSDSDDLPDPDSFSQQMQSRSQGATAASVVGADALFLKIREDGQKAGNDLPAPDALFQQMQAREATLAPVPDPVADDLPDPNALFLQMQAREAAVTPPATEIDDLPDPNALFLQMQANMSSESAYVDTGNEWLPPLPEPAISPPRAPLESKTEEKGGLFSRLKAKFLGEKKTDSHPLDDSSRLQDPIPATGVGAALPDPAELFRRMQAEADDPPSELPSPNELFRRLKSGAAEHPVVDTPSGLPALPDLDALRAEMEAEERAKLDADLLGDLSGPERFADTVSDLAFNVGSFFQAPPQPGSLHKPPERRQDKLTPPPRPPQPDESLPATLSKPEAKPARPASGGYQSPPPTAYQPAPITYQPSPAPVKRKSSSTSLTSKGVTTKSAEEKADLSTRLARFKSRRKALSRYTLSVVTRQMAAMLKAGIGLHQAVSFCAESDPEAAPVLNDVCDKIGAGYSLSGALKEYPGSFDPVFVGLVHAGELSGRLTEMLGKLADMLERELELRKRVIAVITYPAMLMAVSVLGTLGFIFFVLPQLTPMFLDLKVDLPLPTKILLSLRTVLLPLTVTFATLCLLVFAMRSRIETYVAARPFLARRLAYFPLALPVLGPVYDKMVTARVLYSMAVMLEVGVTMNQALARAEGTSGNAYVGYRLSKARMDLAEGASVAECFQNHSVFPETALQLISAGEESARLVDMFSYIARHFDDEVEQAMTTAAGLLEPIIMVVMGLVVGFITIAAALPTIKLLQGF